MTVRAPAKVNLYLRVGARRPDGFHELHTVYQAVSVLDEVTASPARDLSLRVTGEADGVPADRTNLMWRAAELLASSAGVRGGADLSVRKAIPVAGGMAGGSADAAAALVACAAVWGVAADLPALAARLGSDVPFALVGGTAVGTGRGEVLRAVECAPLHWALAFADFGIGTADAYREWDRLQAASARLPEGALPASHAQSAAPLLAALVSGDAERIGPLLHNDLQAAALSLAPVLGDTLAAGREAGAVAGIVSGSGPTCAFLCRTADHAAEVAAALARRGRSAVAHGPVPGPALPSSGGIRG